MNVNLAYGEGWLPIEVPGERTTVIEPNHWPGLGDEQSAVREALEHPLGCRPLREWLRPDSRVCVVFTDITRATPNHRLIPWLLEYLKDIPRERITLLNGLGTHRPNTPAELEKMLTPEVARGWRVLNHEPENPAALVHVGRTREGAPILLNRHLVEAGVRILTGFIEPHFFAGFSGGPKAILPGVAGLQTVMHNHGAGHISHPNAAFGVTEGNPLWEEMRDGALLAGESFLLNVTLNSRKEITGVFAGDLLAAHRAGTDFVRRSAMQAVPEPFDMVVTTNSGYPLDLNLYQGVKGMSAAARVVKPGGTIILAAECREGLPAGSHYERLLRSVGSPREFLERVKNGLRAPDLWQIQIQAQIQCQATVLVKSSLPDDAVRAALLEPCHDISAEISRRLGGLGPAARVAVLPQGPLTIPYLQNGKS
jgi:nickel-dependent lactate racemase